MHDILKRKLFQNPSSILVRVASSDVGTRPKSGGLGNMVELKVTMTIRFPVQLFSLVVSLLLRHCRHPKGAISVHIRSCFSFASLKLYRDGRVFRNTKAETLRIFNSILCLFYFHRIQMSFLEHCTSIDAGTESNFASTNTIAAKSQCIFMQM